MRKLLFLCSGNYYRSRFAEEYFNHLAHKNGLNWKAHSLGLSQNMPSPTNPGSISVHTLEALKARNIEGQNVDRFPAQVEDHHFSQHDMIVALSEAEHKPMLKERFHQHLPKISFLEVGDLPLESPDQAISKIAGHVEEMIDDLDS